MTPFKLVIVGGGSAGWMAATYLQAALRDNGRRPVDISLVESPDVPRIGVGEATVPNIRHILDVIGIAENDFLRQVDGTFKQAIKYANWVHGKGEYYYHAFDHFQVQPIDRTASRWLRSNRSIPFSETHSVQPAVCELGRAPKPLDPQRRDATLRYAYHMNALKFADLLTDIGTSRGIHHYRDHVTDVELTEAGDIAAVLTRGGLRLDADLFIDCTGFAALLIEKQLGVEWIDCSQWMLCDRAVTMNVHHDDYYPGYVRPYTTASALSAGWVWEIPLQNRKALGYVHSSAYLDLEDAEREIRQFEGPHAENYDTRTVFFKVGHREKPWVRNCIAIGLAGNFIEPLESTGLYLSDLATVMLAQHFPLDGDMAPMAWRFNRIMVNRFYEILDFINMHYCLTRRRDTDFWLEVQKPERINDRLQAKLDFWRAKVPTANEFVNQQFLGQRRTPLPTAGVDGDHRPPADTATVFSFASYEAILFGMEYGDDFAAERFGVDRNDTRMPRYVSSRLAALEKLLPRHEAWLQQVLDMPDYPVTAGSGR